MALSPDSENKNSLQTKAGAPRVRANTVWEEPQFSKQVGLHAAPAHVGAALEDLLLSAALLRVDSLISMKSCLFSTMALPRLLPSSIILQHNRKQSMRPRYPHSDRKRTNAPSSIHTDNHDLIFTFSLLCTLFLHLHWQQKGAITPECCTDCSCLKYHRWRA